MKKSLVCFYTIALLLISTISFADHGHDASSAQLKLALDLSGQKLHVSSIKIKKNRKRLADLRLVLNEKKKRREISDDDYDAKMEIIEGYEQECVEIEADMVELDAVIKIKHTEYQKATIKVQIGDKEKEEEHENEREHHKHKHKKHHDGDYDEDEDDHDHDHHDHHREHDDDDDDNNEQ